MSNVAPKAPEIDTTTVCEMYKNERNKKKTTLCKIENLTIEKWVQAVSILIQVGPARQNFRDWPSANRGLLRFQTFVLQNLNWWQIFVLPAKVFALRGRSKGDVQNDSGQIIVKLLCGRPSGIPRGCSLAAVCVCVHEVVNFWSIVLFSGPALFLSCTSLILPWVLSVRPASCVRVRILCVSCGKFPVQEIPVVSFYDPEPRRQAD